jgi:DNA polymerase III alpha subunit (gram-positive type)
VTRRTLNQNFFGPLIVLGMLAVSFGLSADQTGDCTSGTQYCEDNGLTTINTTVTTNTNTNNNTNNNTNTNTNTNSNTNNNTNTNTNVNTNTNTSTNNNNNVNTSTNNNVNTSTSNNISTNTNNNNNVNTSTSTSNSTVNSTVNQNVNNTSNSTSNNTNTNSNTNVNQSTSDSNVTTDNTNTNNNNNTSDNTNRNINQSNSTQTINQNVKSEAPPASAIAPSIMSYSQDLCTVGRSGAFQGQVFGFSTGATVKDENCERLKLSKYLYDTGMKVASVSILCQDPRVFVAMEMAGTPCPYKGKIGKEATASWLENKTDRPDYKVWYKEEAAKCKRVWHSNTQLKKECIAGLK